MSQPTFDATRKILKVLESLSAPERQRVLRAVQEVVGDERD